MDEPSVHQKSRLPRVRVQVDLNLSLAARLDAWIAKRPGRLMKRPKAIRVLLDLALKSDPVIDDADSRLLRDLYQTLGPQLRLVLRRHNIKLARGVRKPR